MARLHFWFFGFLSITPIQAQAGACRVLYHGQNGYPSAQSLILDGVNVVSTGSLGNLSPMLSGGGANLAQYDAIWIHWINSAPTSEDATAVNAYLSAGGGVHFSTDYNGTTDATYRTWLSGIMNGQIAPGSGGGSISVAPNTGLIGGSYASPWQYNASAINDVDSHPFALSTTPPPQVSFDNGGALIGAIPPQNRVAYQGDLNAADSPISVAAFAEADMRNAAGRITFFGDVGTLGTADQTSSKMLIIKNLQSFLLASSGCRAPLAATNDSGLVESATGGQAIGNVLENDEMNHDGLHGLVVPTLGSVVTLRELAGTNTAPAGYPMVLNTATGAVQVAAGTPPGAYSLQYQYCQISRPDNCASATASVVVLGLAPANILLSQASSNHPLGAIHQIVATVTDANGTPVANAKVTLAIASGPNAGTSLTANTNAMGQASFSYAGTGGTGIDAMSATTDDPRSGTIVSNNLTVTWTAPASSATAIPSISSLGLMLLATAIGWLPLRLRRGR